MAFAPDILTSLHGRLLGLGRLGELILGKRDAVVSALAYVNTAASAAVTNTTTETAFDVSYTLKANSVRAGSRLKIRFQGIATATNSTDTLTIVLKIGGVSGTALLSLAANDVANDDIFGGELELVFRTVGASGTMVGWGMTVVDADASGDPVVIRHLASTSVDTTADQAIVVTADWSVANAGNSCRLDILSVEIA